MVHCKNSKVLININFTTPANGSQHEAVTDGIALKPETTQD